MGGVVKSIKKAVGSILGSGDSAKAAKQIAEAQKQAAAAVAQAQEQAANIQRNFAQDLQLENIAQIVPGQEQTAAVSDVKKRRRPQIGLASQLGLDL